MVRVTVTTRGGTQLQGDMSEAQARELVHTWTGGQVGRPHFLLGWQDSWATVIQWINYADVAAIGYSKKAATDEQT